MKQALRKTLAVLIVLSIVLSVGIIAISGSAAVETVFSDDFNTGTLADHQRDYGWYSSGTGSLSGGKYLLTANGYNYLKNNTTLNPHFVYQNCTLGDYTIEVDVQFATRGGNGLAGIVGRMSNATKNGYEYGIFLKGAAAVPSVRLRRVDGNVALGGGVKTFADLGITKSITDTFHLKMTMSGSEIECWLDDVKVYEATESTHTAGVPAVRTSGTGTTAYFDNVVITREVADASSSPESSQTSSTASTPAGPLFFDDFNTGTLADHVTDYGWYYSNSGTVSDGRYLSNVNKYNYLRTATDFNPHFVYQNCTLGDYTIETDVQFATRGGNGLAGIVGRVTDATKNGYEFGIFLNGTDAVPSVRLRRVDGNVALGGGVKAFADCGITKEITDTFHLKMTMLGNRIVCWVDDVKVYDVTEDTHTVGVPAVRTSGTGTTAYFDNFKVSNAVLGDDSVSSSVSSDESSSQVSSTEITSSDAISSGGKYHFEDNFNAGSIHADWAYDTGSVVNGVYHLNAGGGAANSNWVNTTAAKNLTAYAVQADVAFGTATSGSSTQPTAGIIVRAQSCDRTSAAGKGYEYALTFRTDGTSTMPQNKLFVRLYERGGTEPFLSAGNVVAVEDILGAGNDDRFGTYTLRVEVIGNRIKCFINGHVAFDMTDDTWSSGAFGVRSAINEVAVDNVVVDEIDAFSTGLPPIGGGSSSSSSSTSSNNSSSGSTSSGGSAPGYTYPEGVYYQDDFSTADFVNKGWNRALTTENDRAKLYAFNAAYMTNRADLMQLKDYTVEATVSLETSEPAKGGSNSVGVIARSSGANKGYYFGFYSSGDNRYCRLYDLTAGKSLAQKTFLFSYDYAYRLRLVVKGEEIFCYVGDQLVIYCTNSTNTQGTAGIRQSGYPAYFDDYIVRVSTQEETTPADTSTKAPKADKNGIYFSDNFNTRASLLTTQWNDNNAILENDRMYVDFNKEANLSGDAGFAMLKDYVVQADITITNMVPKSSGSSVVSVVARGNYEFSLVYTENGSGYLRIYNRAARQAVTENHTYAVKEGDTVTLTLMVEGDKLRGFANGQLIFDVQDTALTDGNMGVRTAYTSTHFDNFVVRKITAADRTAANINTATTPSTGDSLTYVTVALCAMLLAAAVLLLAKRRAILR